MTAALHVSENPIMQVAAWRADMLSLNPQRIPCPGILSRGYGAGGRTRVWTNVHVIPLTFLDACGERAAELGGSDVGLLGVHRTAGVRRSDSTGVPETLYPYAVAAMDARMITLIRANVRLVFQAPNNPSASVPPLARFSRRINSCARGSATSCRRLRRARVGSER